MGFTMTLSEADCTLSKGWTEPDCLSQITSTMKEFTKRKSGKDVDAIDEYQLLVLIIMATFKKTRFLAIIAAL